MKFKDYYQTLGVASDADAAQIKLAYRKKARQFHPDVSKEANAEEKFKEINEAYEVLRDDSRRAEYDQLKHHGFNAGDDFRRPPNWDGDWTFGQGRRGQPSPHGAGNAEFSDFFSTIFGQAGFGQTGGFGQAEQPFGQRQRSAPFGPDFRAQSSQPGANIQLTAPVSLALAYSGGKLNVTIPSGHGQSKKVLSVKIPAGVTDGRQLRLKGQGRPGRAGGKVGDLLVNVALQPHEWFQVDGADIILPVPITALEAAEGATLTLPTLGGSVAVAVPPGTRSGTRLRLRRRGLPADPHGDQYLIFQIQLPENLSRESLDLLRALDAAQTFSPRADFASEKAVPK